MGGREGYLALMSRLARQKFLVNRLCGCYSSTTSDDGLTRLTDESDVHERIKK